MKNLATGAGGSNGCVALSYPKIDATAADRTAYTAALTGNYENESWIVGAYHPITKHLNLVGEYTNTEYTNVSNFRGYDGKAKTFSLGAILFF